MKARIDLLARLKGITRGRVNIAVVESLSISFLPDLLIAFSRKFPGVQASITVAGSDTVTELVREREADVGVTFNPSALDGLTVEFERGIALGRDHGAHPSAGQVEIADFGAVPGISGCLAGARTQHPPHPGPGAWGRERCGRTACLNAIPCG